MATTSSLTGALDQGTGGVDEGGPIAPTTTPATAADVVTAANTVEVDENIDEHDSAYGGDGGSVASSMTSLTSGVFKYREENGRRYHAYKEGSYLLPNDEKEQDRLDLHHHVFYLSFAGKLFLAPIDKPAKVLDIGTGTGIWCMDFADAHPECHVIGWDLSPIQPSWVPPNLEFQVDDAEGEWNDTKYDYIHIRMLSGALKDWEALMAKAYDHLNPGGYIEVTEFEIKLHADDGTLTEDSMIYKWQTLLGEAAESIGRTFDVGPRLKEWIEKAGFVEVVQDHRKIPSTPWAKNRKLKEIGLYQQQNMLDATSSYGAAHFTRVLGWTAGEFMILSAGCRDELKNPKIHSYANLYTVWGKKHA